MKKVSIAIAFVSLYLLLYQSGPYFGIPDPVILAMFAVSPFLLITMVYIILKDGPPSKFTFDERFYDDFNYEKNGKEAVDH